MNRKQSLLTLGLCAVVGLVLLTACSKKPSEESAAPSTAATPAATPIDPATAASVSGTVSLAGTAPKGAKIDMSQDPACKGTNTAETVVADGGKLSNVFVYVKEGLGNRTFDVPAAAVTIDQSGCKYHPHVLGVMAGQTLKIVNSDPTTHNIHPTPADSREWNESQPPQSPALEKTFAREEINVVGDHRNGALGVIHRQQRKHRQGDGNRNRPPPALMFRSLAHENDTHDCV